MDNLLEGFFGNRAIQAHNKPILSFTEIIRNTKLADPVYYDVKNKCFAFAPNNDTIICAVCLITASEAPDNWPRFVALENASVTTHSRFCKEETMDLNRIGIAGVEDLFDMAIRRPGPNIADNIDWAGYENTRAFIAAGEQNFPAVKKTNAYVPFSIKHMRKIKELRGKYYIPAISELAVAIRNGKDCIHELDKLSNNDEHFRIYHFCDNHVDTMWSSTVYNEKYVCVNGSHIRYPMGEYPITNKNNIRPFLNIQPGE